MAIDDENHSYTKIDPSSPAFILYLPEVHSSNKAIFYNQEFLNILSQCCSSKNFSSSNISSFCLRWKKLLERSSSKLVKSGEHNNYEFCVVEFIRSNRRLYAVRGILLLNHNSHDTTTKNYLFMLDRICHDKMNLPLFSRMWNLSNREKDLVRLLLEDKSNKEIAHILNLSTNTVKGYLKMLMRKLGVTSRAGIVSSVFRITHSSSQLQATDKST